LQTALFCGSGRNLPWISQKAMPTLHKNVTSISRRIIVGDWSTKTRHFGPISRHFAVLYPTRALLPEQSTIGLVIRVDRKTKKAAFRAAFLMVGDERFELPTLSV
tara:strand:+ start:5988 stop:6302 length:315 start_codon:yes stop_codon:yes gene_type:complete